MSSEHAYVTPGMPALEHGERVISRFEFWPLWAMYLPVAIQWLGLSLWYRSPTLALLANPRLPVSGMMGVGKSELMAQARRPAEHAILPWIGYRVDARDRSAQAAHLVGKAALRGIELPFVCKPDIGCRGSGVKLIESLGDMESCLSAYPEGAALIVQRLSRYEPEAGIFYVRMPGEPEGRIVSLALKYSPYVVGDGHSTLAELMAADPRAGRLRHLYEERHLDRLDRVLARGERFRLIFANSHSRGSIFRDARHLVTPALTEAIDRILSGLPDFHYGRLDVRFPDVAHLRAGRELQVVEINAASAEPLHIWDRGARLREAYAALLAQYRLLFRIGHRNRRRGFRPPALREVRARWQAERQGYRFHPPTD